MRFANVLPIAAVLASMPLDAADPGCEVPKLVSTGGPFPRNSHTLAIRWTGYSNFELAYNSQVILLDAYFDRGSTYPPLGFKADLKSNQFWAVTENHPPM
jgi:hypothetical protein